MIDPKILQFFKDLYENAPSGVQIYFTQGLKSEAAHLVVASKVLDFCREQNENKSLFFTPNLFQPGVIKSYGRGRTDNAVRVITCLFWDIDSFRIDQKYLDDRNFPTPSYLFRRGDRAHIYYILETPLVITSALDPVAKKVTKILKVGQKILNADPAPTHIGSVMRAPGTAHVKHGHISPGYELPIVENMGKKYQLEDFNFILEQAGGEVAKKAVKAARAKAQSIDEIEIRNILLGSNNIITAGGGRSNALFRFGIRCRDWGLEEENALEIAKEFNQSFCRPPEESNIVEHQVHSAYTYASGPAGKLLTKGAEQALEEFRLDLHVSHCLQDWVFVQETGALYHSKKPIVYQPDQVSTGLSYLTGLSVKIGYVVGNRLVQICDKMSFRPDFGSRQWQDESGVTYFNSFAGLVKARSTGKEIHVKRFIDHCHYITRTEEEAKHLMRYISVCLCYPSKKIRHAVLLVSPYQGTGKSSFEELFRTLLQSPTGHSYVSVGDNKAMAHGWNEFIDSNLVTFFHEVGQDKYSAMDSIKTWITEKKIRINGKFARNYTTDNFTNFFLTTNNINALPVDDKDRKLFIVECREKPRDQQYYIDLHESFSKGAGDILEFLHTIKDELDIYAHPPMTDSKLLMQAQTKSEVAILLDDLYDSDEPIFKAPFALKQLIDLMYMAAPISVRSSISQKSVTRWLLARGFQHKQVRTGDDAGWKYHPPSTNTEKNKKGKTA